MLQEYGVLLRVGCCYKLLQYNSYQYKSMSICLSLHLLQAAKVTAENLGDAQPVESHRTLRCLKPIFGKRARNGNAVKCPLKRMFSIVLKH